MQNYHWSIESEAVFQPCSKNMQHPFKNIASPMYLATEPYDNQST